MRVANVQTAHQLSDYVITESQCNWIPLRVFQGYYFTELIHVQQNRDTKIAHYQSLGSSHPERYAAYATRITLRDYEKKVLRATKRIHGFVAFKREVFPESCQHIRCLK